MFLLKGLMGMLADVRLKDTDEPNQDVPAGYKVAGVVSEPIRRLYVVCNTLAQEVNNTAERHRKEASSFKDGVPAKQNARMNREYRLAKNAYDNARLNLRDAVYHEIPEALEAPVGVICKG